MNTSSNRTQQNKKRVQQSKNRVQQNKPNKKQKSSINPSSLIQAAEELKLSKHETKLLYMDMDLNPRLKTNLNKMGFIKPTEIQEKTYKNLILRQNLIGIANTGTGKTGAFLIPIIHNLLDPNQEQFKSLVIVPTRELALQVEQEFKKLTVGMEFRSSCHIGGTNLKKDINRLKQSNDIFIGTPGRLIDLINRGDFNISQVETLILDEFDRMLDMGFVNDIKKIIGRMKNRKHTMLFSATIDPKQKLLIHEIVSNPITVAVSNGETSSKNVAQDIIRVPVGANKFDMLKKLLAGQSFNKVILFAETKRLADRLSKKLNQSGILSDQIHGNKSQNYRVKALNKFKTGSIKVLVATDVAARGVDIDSVTHVINYQLPLDYDTYIHRIGRTGRAGKTGMAYTFID
ncbi:DEAD/DEAH box helicase [Paracrocinitomix mangrovi]|uniref:DEAD/DEAH box helicase n=1 Tax=Paracrocinitomix mangrovi TaxID=2862509 RepID=UPI001C8D3403|nr:DEAD/DEAH box helicase [Paracrocinitomix mangrovi]UKN02333.1 DEAD/DEAH box helicase [Paracrocinitomix mangrovi]